MPLNKLDNFIKNTEGRILYVSPDDLDSTDSISNEGNSLARPFKTLQRALIESARFSYIKGRSNDLVEKTTILLMPGDHVIDNRPGLAIYNSGGTAKVRRPHQGGSGSDVAAGTELNLDLNSKFDITQNDNILYKFNSIHGGVVVPRGTSVVGLDLRKTKLRPKYVPNPTYSDVEVPRSAIFRVTGGCYFWQFSIFDGNDLEEVYTNPDDFTISKKATPTFSHHKLTVFEYADGVNKAVYKDQRYDLTDLDMYYAKIGNAYNEGASTREIKSSEKWPTNPLAFEKRREEYEIVGAFDTDPILIDDIQAGDAGGVTPIVTVTTKTPHGLQVGTPIKIRGVNPSAFNASSIVLTISNTDDKVFTYSLPGASTDALGDGVGDAEDFGGNVTVETDTVQGASPYIFNCSLRSVYGMNGMKANGNNATGFKSMVVAQFTGVSLQKDDRAFVKYDSDSRSYSGTSIEQSDASTLSSGSSNTADGTAYHLDSGAIYRQGWESTHITITNDAILQIVSVFAIGYARHFFGDTGADASITNSNSNFGQLSLVADGFKKEAFEKDNKAFITSIISPRQIETDEDELQWVGIDTTTTVSVVGNTSRLYFATYKSKDNKPPISIQGFKPGAKSGELLSVEIDKGGATGIVTYTSPIVMPTYNVSNSKEYVVTTSPTAASNEFTIGTNNLEAGEKVIVISDDGDLPENIETDTVYYVIKEGTDKIKLAASESDSTSGKIITVSGGTNLKIVSRVTDKEAGEAKHPVQWDDSTYNGVEVKQWYVNTVGADNNIYNNLKANFVDHTTNNTYIKRKADTRSLDEKVYKLRVVIPKELKNAKNPENGFVIQESSTTGARNLLDFTLSTDLTVDDYEFKRNPGFISTCGGAGAVKTVRTELPHKLNIGDSVIIKNVRDNTNSTGVGNSGYNGTYPVLSVPNDMEFTYQPSPTVSANFTSNTSTRNTDLPRFERNDLQSNLYIYRSETIRNYSEGVQDGIYHLYVLSADKTTPLEFTDYNYSQNIVDLYPQMDRDNVLGNPRASSSFAKRSPLGEVVTNDLKKSITREALDDFSKVIGIGVTISSVVDSGTSATLNFAKPHGFAGILTGRIDAAGASYNNGTFYNIKLLDGSANPSATTWKGATAKVSIVGNAIQSAEIQSHGSGYAPTDLYFDQTFIAGNGAGRFEVHQTGISSAVGNGIQITGIGTTSSGFYQIASVPTDKSITITKTATDVITISNQYVFPTAPALSVSQVFDATTKTTTFTSTKAHGLVKGNGFRVLNSSNTLIFDGLVSDVPTGADGVTKFKAVTNTELSNVSVVLKYGYAANGEVSDKSNENLGARSTTVFENNHAYLSAEMTSDGTSMQLDVVGIVTSRFQYGSYVEVGSEIMRIASPLATGGSNNILKVIRGALATNSVAHLNGSLVKAIKPLPIEFHRPSILRASGHTFEYLGYGPGNYSTALPQVQDRTLTDREEFLVQSQEKAGGIVVYTGMNNKGDFYIGNLKKSSATGEETTFDTPIPTVTGETPSRLSAIFDEVTVKERIVVEGGDGTDIPSKFDGPVTFNNNARFNGGVDLSTDLKINSPTASSSTSSGALQVTGGAGIVGTLFAGNITSPGTVTATNFSTKVDSDDRNYEQLNTDGGLELVRSDQSETVGGPYLDFSERLPVSEGGSAFVADMDARIQMQVSGTWTEKVGNAGDLHFYTIADRDDYPNNTAGGLGGIGLRLELIAPKAASSLPGGAKIHGKLDVTNDIIAYSSSDKRLKDNISPIKQALDKVKSISGNTFNWNGSSQYEGKGDTGVIAQEIEALGLPGVTTTREDGFKAVRYEKLVPVLIEAIKELSAKVDNLEQKLSDK
jgi:hypothetical protein